MPGFKLTDKDYAVLSTVDPRLEIIVVEAAKISEQAFVVFEGARTISRQIGYVKKGVSKTLKSFHIPGLAVDLVPLINGNPVWDAPACRVIAMAMSQAAARLLELKLIDVGVTWGGSWKWFDGPHFQLKVPYPTPAPGNDYPAPTFPKRTPLKGAASVPPNKQPVRPSQKPAPGGEGIRSRQEAWVQSSLVSHQGVVSKSSPANVVKELQRALRDVCGEERIPVDGIYGAATAGAVRRFQQRHGLTEDGLAGAVTIKKLGEAVAALGQPQPHQPHLRTHLASMGLLTPATDVGTTLPTDHTTPTTPDRKGIRTMLQGKKTYLIAGLAVLGAIGSFLSGDISQTELVAYIVNSLFAMTIRDGLNTVRTQITGR